MLPVDIDTLATPAIYYRERVFLTEFDPIRNTRHWFGGKLDLDVVGLPHGPHPLHRMVTLDLTDKRLGIEVPPPLVHIPLVYGMRFDGCDLTYELTSARQISVKRSSQQTSSDDWPYEDFPDTTGGLKSYFTSRRLTGLSSSTINVIDARSARHIDRTLVPATSLALR